MRVSERGVADGGRLIGRRSYRMTSVHSTTRAREGPRRAAATPGVARTRQARASPPSSLHAGVAIQRRACRAVRGWGCPSAAPAVEPLSRLLSQLPLRHLVAQDLRGLELRLLECLVQ